ncbi:MAG: glutamate-5-semialdehyde dehydrogenase [Bacteroidales bacterium]|jgi:glutamate-5-semialdehyde dehydrogenase
MDCTPLFKKVSESARSLLSVESAAINNALLNLADEIEANIDLVTAENERDLKRMEKSDSRYDRLLLTPGRIRSIAADIRNIVRLPDPAGRLLSENVRPNGLKISRISVPFGVIGVIFEARPNVVLDVFALCLKSRNGCILKGGSDARDSNKIIVRLIKSALGRSGIDKDILGLLPPGRSETSQMLKARDYIDLVIPRGSRGLIDFVRENATIPVIETGAGICHTYFDRYGDREKGRIIVNNAKTRRVGVCNALDCLIIHRDRLPDLEHIVGLCANSGVVIYADEDAFMVLKGKYPEVLLLPAGKDSYGTEFLSFRMAVKTVSTIEEALQHIATYGSKHSEAIISEDHEAISLFLNMVDASSVYSNASTAFTDGAEFGLGAEIGISTQKLHARGPMALEELTTYKWVIEGNGQVRG